MFRYPGPLNGCIGIRSCLPEPVPKCQARLVSPLESWLHNLGLTVHGELPSAEPYVAFLIIGNT